MLRGDAATDTRLVQVCSLHRCIHLAGFSGLCERAFALNTITPPIPFKRGPGRPKGSPNRSNPELLQKLQVCMKERFGLDNYDPAIALAEIACDQSNPLDLRLRAHSAILPYVRAQLKAVEVSGPDGAPIEVKNTLVEKIIDSFDFKEVD